jgi:hypothetical protein
MMQDWADFLDETLRSGAYKLIPPSCRIEREEALEGERQPVARPRRGRVSNR